MPRKAAKRQAAAKMEGAGGDAEHMHTWQDDPRVITVQPNEDSEIDEAFDDLPESESSIDLYRIKSEQGGRPAFIERLSPSLFSMAYVKENYGGGRYQAKAKYKDGTRKKLSFDIEGPRLDLTRTFVNPNTGNEVARHGSSVGHTQFPVTRAESPLSPGYDSRMNLPTTRDELASLVRMLVQEVVNGAQVKTESRADFYKELAIMREIFQQPVQPQAPMEQLIAMFSRGVEMAANGSAEGPSFWLTAMKEMKEPLMQLMGTIQTAMIASKGKDGTTAGVPVRPPQTGTSPHIAPGGQAAVDSFGAGGEGHDSRSAVPYPAAGEDAMIQQALKMFMPALINGAAKNTEVDLYVDFMLDQIPDSLQPKLLAWLQKPDCLDTLAAVEPGIRFQREWWVALRAALIEALTEGASDDRGVQSGEDTNTPTGPAGHS